MSIQIGGPAFAFLSQPPPAIQKRQRSLMASQPPSGPLPPTPPRTSTTDSTITSWATEVQPGSPVAPSPRLSSLSCQRRPSLGRRRSASRIGHARVPSNSLSFLNLIETPSPHHSSSPSATNFVPNTADLRAQGYTIFVSLPPETPQSAHPIQTKQIGASPPRAAPTKPVKSLKSFRSLSVLRPSHRATPSSPTGKHNNKSLAHASGSEISAKPSPRTFSLERVRSRSKSRTKPHSPTTSHRLAMQRKAQIAATLANEAAISQFLGGGKLETHVQALVPTGDAVYRDETGGLWRDEAERVEHVPLLGDNGKEVGKEKENGSPISHSREWIRFSTSSPNRTGDGKNSPRSKATALLDFLSQNDDDDVRAARRGSAGSVSTAEMMTREPMNIEQDVGKLVWLPSSRSTSSSSSGGVKHTSRRRSHRPTPLNISPRSSPSSSVVATAFEDSFTPAEVPPSTPVSSSARIDDVCSSSSTLALPLLDHSSGSASTMSATEDTRQRIKSKASKSGLRKLFSIKL